MGMASGLWLLVTAQVFAGNFYAGTSPAHVPWPDGIVPYAFTNTLTAGEQETYLDGLREWELAADVQFVPRTTRTHWILFTYDFESVMHLGWDFDSTNPGVLATQPPRPPYFPRYQ